MIWRSVIEGEAFVCPQSGCYVIQTVVHFNNSYISLLEVNFISLVNPATLRTKLMLGSNAFIITKLILHKYLYHQFVTE